jgi:hypothetical protein
MSQSLKYHAETNSSALFFFALSNAVAIKASPFAVCRHIPCITKEILYTFLIQPPLYLSADGSAKPNIHIRDSEETSEVLRFFMYPSHNLPRHRPKFRYFDLKMVSLQGAPKHTPFTSDTQAFRNPIEGQAPVPLLIWVPYGNTPSSSNE